MIKTGKVPRNFVSILMHKVVAQSFGLSHIGYYFCLLLTFVNVLLSLSYFSICLNEMNKN